MSSPIQLIAIITPKADKVDRVLELLNDMAAFIEKNEPDTLRWHIHREVNKKSGLAEIILLETYKSTAAMGAHGTSKEFKAMNKNMGVEGLIAAPLQIKFIKPVGGFSSRL